MESLSTAELLEVAALSRASYDAQFQYWLGVTFALIVARFSFADRFHLRWRVLVTVLYVASSYLFFSRYGVELTVAGIYRDAALARGAAWYEGNLGLLFWIRFGIWVFGTAVTSFLVVRGDPKPITSGGGS